MVDSVNLQAVTFQRAPLGEGLFAVVAPVWTDSCMCTCVPLQIECIVEALSTEGARYRCATSCDDSAASPDQRFFHKCDRQTSKGRFHIALAATFHSPSSLARRPPSGF